MGLKELLLSLEIQLKWVWERKRSVPTPDTLNFVWKVYLRVRNIDSKASSFRINFTFEFKQFQIRHETVFSILVLTFCTLKSITKTPKLYILNLSLLFGQEFYHNISILTDFPVSETNIFSRRQKINTKLQSNNHKT